MDSSLIQLLISLASGAAGGNIAGALLKNISLGTLWNSVAGIVGGGLGAKILAVLLPVLAANAGGGGLDLGAIIGQIGGGGVGGAVLMAIVGMIKASMKR